MADQSAELYLRRLISVKHTCSDGRRRFPLQRVLHGIQLSFPHHHDNQPRHQLRATL